MKKLLILALPLLILFVGFAKAQCVVPYENMEITRDTTFCQGTYYLNDSDKNSSIIVTGSNLVLDCNNSAIIGSFIQDSIGIRVTGNNVTVKNCRAEGYWYAIVLEGDPNYLDNATVKDGFFTIVTGSGKYYLTNIKCLGNYTDTCIHEGDVADYIYLENISIKTEFDVPWGIFFTRLSSGDFKNIYLYYENYTHALEGRVAGLGLANVSNVNVENIVTENLSFPLAIDYCWGGDSTECGENRNVRISNFEIKNTLIGISFKNVSFSSIEFGKIYSAKYGKGIEILDSENINIKNLESEEASSNGIWVENSLNVNLENINVEAKNCFSGVSLWNVNNSLLRNVSVENGDDTNIDLRMVKNLTVKNITVKFSGPTGGLFVIGEDINISNVYAYQNVRNIVLGFNGDYRSHNILIENSTIIGNRNYDTGIRLEGTYNITLRNNKITNCWLGTWFCCPESYNVIVDSNEVWDCDACVGTGEYNSNITILNNNLSYCGAAVSVWGTNYGIWNVKVLNNTIKNSDTGVGIWDAYNIEIKNNYFENTNEVFEYALNVSNLTSCQNTIKNCNSTYGIILFEHRKLNLRNVMRPDSDSCTPYINLVAPRSVDFGVIKLNKNFTNSFQIEILSNMLDLKLNVTKDFAFPAYLSYTKLDMDKVSFYCFTNTTTWESISCSEFNETKSSNSFQIPFENFELLPFADSYINMKLTITPNQSSTSIKFRVKSEQVEDSQDMTIKYYIPGIPQTFLTLLMLVVGLGGIVFTLRIFSIEASPKEIVSIMIIAAISLFFVIMAVQIFAQM